MSTRKKLNKFVTSPLSVLLFFGLSVGLFLPTAPVLLLFSLFLPLIAAVQVMGLGAMSFLMTGLASLIGMVAMSRLPGGPSILIPLLLLVLWGCVFLIHVHTQRLQTRGKKIDDEKHRIHSDIEALEKEVQFYEARQLDLTRRGEQRRFLVRVARELGSLLDPQEIQIRLIDSTEMLFPQKKVTISYGQSNDPVDNFVIQRRQSVQAPNTSIKGRPVLAAPITAQSAVAGVLKVAGNEQSSFTREDLRLLDILASLASLALDNVVLFRQVQDTALRDGLTHLFTHRAFQERLEAEILEASRFGNAISVVLTDIDHFKSVNDTHGHQAGDKVLVSYTQRLIRHARDIDVVARYGGEEFILLLPHMGHENALALAELMRREVEAQPFDVGSQQIKVTGSFGVATFPADATSAQQLIRQADQRLYKAKEGGRNQVKGK